ncbi:hypothetical protein, partial [Acidianus sp. RZ1]
MLGKLIKFIILSRIRKSVIIINFLIILFIISAVIPAPLNPSFIDDTVIFFSLTILIYSINAGMVVTKSDADFLLTIPIDQEKISISLYLANFLISSFFSLYFGIFAIKILGLLGVAVLFLFSLLAVSLSIALSNVGIKFRALFGSLIALW